MANNYCKFAGVIKVEGRIADARRSIEKTLRDIVENDAMWEYDEDAGPLSQSIGGISFSYDEDEDDGFLYYYSEENGDLTVTEHIIRNLVDDLQIDEPISLQWAFTCSKPRPDEFGGGAFVVRRGKKTEWLDTSDWVQKVIG